LTASGISVQTKVFDSNGWRMTSSMMLAGNCERMVEIWLMDVAEIPEVVRRSVDVKARIRKRPVEGKSRFIN
jgi:hypothetical protein